MTGNAALLVIDMQEVAFDGRVTPPIVDGDSLLRTVARLIEGWRAANRPIVYVQTSAAPGQPYARDVHGWRIHPDVAPVGDDIVVTKRHSSGFDGTDLAGVLERLGVTGVITCGIWSQFCVANTSRDAAGLGLNVWVAADGHGTVAPTAAEAARIVSGTNAQLEHAGISALPVERLLSGAR